MNCFKKLKSKLSQRHHRLSTILMMLIFFWLLGALWLIGLSLNVSWRLEERGVAINDAGSLRKRAFYMVSLANDGQFTKLENEYDDFTLILNNLKQKSSSYLNSGRRHQEFSNQLKAIENTTQILWQMLQQYTQHQDRQYLPAVSILEKFTNEISTLVTIIEKNNTDSIVFLRWLQAILILMAISSAFLSSALLNRLVLLPLKKINQGIKLIANGQFETKITVPFNNEFGQIAVGFNQMSSELKIMYADLESIVLNKTEKLHQRNQNLAFLYNISSLLQNNRDSIQSVSERFLEEIIAYTQAIAGSIRAINPVKNQSKIVVSQNLPQALIESERCGALDGCYCGKAMKNNSSVSFGALDSSQFTPVLCKQFNMNYLVSFQIVANEKKLGTMNLFFTHESDFDISSKNLLESASAQLAIVLTNIRLAQLDQQMAILEERNLMAQGLHDSIAQSLSFLNMQAQVLNSALKTHNESMRDQALSFIQEGIQECYEDVRELLSNFRISLHSGSFEDSINSVIERFQKQMDIKIEYNYLGHAYELSPDKQLQTIFILQEALSNIRKHSHATQVNIDIEQSHQKFKLIVKDNGQGFDAHELEEKRSNGHIGTFIMAERAEKIESKLEITSQRNIGTTVSLVINRHTDGEKEI